MKRLDAYWNSVNAVSVLLLPFAGLFCLISSVRKAFYRLGFLKSYKAPLPVIIIGNISVGGTGKTPLIIELVKQLQLRGKKPAVISRGYGGESSTWPQKITVQTHARTVGDEPQLIFNQTGCPVVAGPDRQQDIALILAEYECDVILSDDGLQHYALQRDIEIAVVDKTKQFGNGFCLPAGPLRERVKRLADVDLVLFNGATSNELGFKMLPSRCLPVGDRCNESGYNETVGLEFFSGTAVHAVAGIGHPERFFSLLRSHNIEVIPHEFADHFIYQASDITFNDDLNVLLTDKDAVKCTQFDLPHHWSVSINISLNAATQAKVNQLFDSLNTIE